MMDERTSRIFIGLCLLVLVWIGVYWMWQPARDQGDPRITFEQPNTTIEEPPVQSAESDQTPPSSPSEQGSLIDQLTATDPDPEIVTKPGPTLLPPEFFEHTVSKIGRAHV